jgi:hypothetical protein
MNVDASGGVWRLTLPDASDRRHQFQVLKNGSVLASGTVNELGFAPTDTNSFNPASFSLTNVAVVQGDKLELRLSPLSGGGSLSADFNDSNIVDGADLTAWKNAFGPGANADADGDGDSDGADFLAWQRQLGSSGGGSSSTEGFLGVKFTIQQSGLAVAVPEPAAAVLWLSALWPLACQRRRGS